MGGYGAISVYCCFRTMSSGILYQVHMVTVKGDNMVDSNPPRFLSVEFHARFFPAFLWSRIRPNQESKSGFSSFTEFYIALAVCTILIAIGVPAGLSQGSIVGWIASGIGMAGILALLVMSISSRWGESPSYAGFLVGFFFFFVFAGLSAGIFISTLEHYTLFHGLLTGVAGLSAGYVLGILAGFGLQYIGWLAAMLDPLVGLAVAGLIVVDIVLLSGALFR